MQIKIILIFHHILVRIQVTTNVRMDMEKGKLNTPWVEMKTSAATLKISLDVSQKH